MPSARKRPCFVCRRLLRPDNRVGSRQHACSKPECQAQRRRRQQAAWRARHPDYFAGRRIQARMVLDDRPAPLRLPPPLEQLPWDIAQSQFGPQGADFLGVMGALLIRSTKFQWKPYYIYSTVDTAILPPLAAQSQIPSGADWSGRGNTGHAAGTAPT